MKPKTVFKTLSLLLLAVAASCGPSAEEKARIQAQKEQETRDSLARVEAERLEKQRQDSLQAEMFKEMYKNALTMESNKDRRYSTKYEGYKVTLTCTVTNNTPIPISASDYALTCTERYATCSDESEPDAFVTVNMETRDIAPGESAIISTDGDGIIDLYNPKVKLKMTEEEFLSKVKQAAHSIDE